MTSILRYAFKPADWLLRRKDKENMFLEGPYAPVDTEVSQECEVIGTLPEALNGLFARNGSNPKLTPTGGYHWFDGDGMVHTVRIKDGKATYSNRWVRTKKLLLESAAGEPLFMNLGDLSSRLAIISIMNNTMKQMVGAIPNLQKELETQANTSLEYHAGRLYALCEGGLPYALRVLCDGVIETLGSASFDNNMKTPFTAHPKRDVATGKLYGYGYNMITRPYMTFYVLDAEGNVERQFPIDLDRPTLMHDFAITETHAIILDLPLMLSGSRLVTNELPLVFEKQEKARMGVIPLDATDASGIKWFDMPETFVAFHGMNAWNDVVGDDGSIGRIKVITSDYFNLDLSVTPKSAESEDNESMLHVTTLDLVTGEVTRTPLFRRADDMRGGVDFPQIRRSLIGRKNRCGYGTVFDAVAGPVAVIKMDAQGNGEQPLLGKIPFGENQVGGECIFVPSKADGEGEEDEGYLVTFISSQDGGNSELRVWNAQTMDRTPVATVKLPARVPLGFHALFVSEEELKLQAQP